MPFNSKNGDAQWDGADILDVRSWSVDDGGAVNEYVSSDTGGGTGRIDGNDDWTCEVNQFQDASVPLTTVLKKGDTGTIKLEENGTLFWSVPVIVLGVSAQVDIESGALIGYVARFGWQAQTGAITRPTP